MADESRLEQSFPSTLKEPEALFLVPFSKDDSFIGREIILAELDEKRRQVGSWNHSRLALVGLGGIGQVARPLPETQADLRLESHKLQSNMHIEFEN